MRHQGTANIERDDNANYALSDAPVSVDHFGRPRVASGRTNCFGMPDRRYAQLSSNGGIVMDALIASDARGWPHP